ncbi:hypothetical protein Tco_0206886 [Tanacetum coccineum]
MTPPRPPPTPSKEIAPEAATAAVVAPPTATPDPAIETGPEAEPSKAPLSPDYVPYSPILAPASPDYHPGSDTESEPMKDDSESIEDAPEAAEPLFAQIAPLPPVHISVIPPSDPTAEAVMPEFIILEATALVIPVRRRRLVEARRWAFARDGEQEIETLRAKGVRAEAHVAALRGLLGISRVRIADLEFRVEDAEDRLEQCERGWIHDRARIRRLEEHLGI